MSTPSNATTTEKAAAPKVDMISTLAKKWKKIPGSLIMALHDLQTKLGYVPRESAMRLGHEMGVPLAQIYEVVTFYNFFKTEAPGKYIISVCLGTACHLKGGAGVLESLSKELNIPEGKSTPDKEFHLQAVRCLGCCGLAPVVSVNNKVYARLKPEDAGHYVVESVKIDKPMIEEEADSVDA
jgi:NADH:ubiquinone oxidoreductase subunit E